MHALSLRRCKYLKEMNTARHINLRVFWLVHLIFVLVVCYEFYENCSPSALIVWPLIIPLLVLNRKRNVFQLNIFSTFANQLHLCFCFLSY